MTRTERAVEITAKLYEARNAARTMFGTRYAEKMREFSDAIRQVMAEEGVNELRAAMLLCAVSESSYQQITILAAAVEMVEPSVEAA